MTAEGLDEYFSGFRGRLRAWLDERDMTMAAFAEDALGGDYTPQLVNQVLLGRRPPSERFVATVSRRLPAFRGELRRYLDAKHGRGQAPAGLDRSLGEQERAERLERAIEASEAALEELRRLLREHRGEK